MNGGKYLALIVILFFNLMTILFMGLRISYMGELLFFVLTLIASIMLIYSVYNQKKYGLFTLLFFMISLVNLYYIQTAYAVNLKINTGTLSRLLYGITLLGNSIGLVIGAYSIEKKESKKAVIEKDVLPKIVELQEKADKIEPWPSVVEAFYPGKYVASKTGAVYHAPKCDWAKKISKSKRVWFADEKDARKNGYRKHSCLKK